MSEQYIVLCGDIVGNMQDGFQTIYGWDGDLYDKRKDAIRAGWKERGSDDFNIGVVRGGRLVGLCWMNEPNKEPPDVLREIEAQIDLYDEEDE
jgi:hypothetical protein